MTALIITPFGFVVLGLVAFIMILCLFAFLINRLLPPKGRWVCENKHCGTVIVLKALHKKPEFDSRSCPGCYRRMHWKKHE